MLLLLNTSCFLSRVIETYCNITWFVWYQILTHNWILVAFRFLEFSKEISLPEKLMSLLISAENWNEKMTQFWRMLRFGCFNKRTILVRNLTNGFIVVNLRLIHHYFILMKWNSGYSHVGDTVPDTSICHQDDRAPECDLRLCCRQ